jgi:hypothetical protein
MTTEFLDASAPIVDAILEAGDQPSSFTVTTDLYRHIDFEGTGKAKSHQGHYHGERPETLYGCRVFVEPGCHHTWSIRTERGELWDASGRRVYT